MLVWRENSSKARALSAMDACGARRVAKDEALVSVRESLGRLRDILRCAIWCGNGRVDLRSKNLFRFN